MEKNSYQLSNKINEVCLNKFSKEYSKKLLSDKDRLNDSINLLNYLCNKFKIPPIKKMVLLNKPRKKNKNTTTFGYYVVNKQEIYIYNLTAITKKEISIKCLYETLLHEFMHHYDRTKLKLLESPHTKGFYFRITDLKNKITY